MSRYGSYPNPQLCNNNGKLVHPKKCEFCNFFKEGCDLIEPKHRRRMFFYKIGRLYPRSNARRVARIIHWFIFDPMRYDYYVREKQKPKAGWISAHDVTRADVMDHEHESTGL